MSGLNDKQWEACSHVEGPLLILAGAGSGKTRVIVHRIAYLIEDMGVNPYNILAITFTNKAAREMRDRVEDQVGFGAESIWVSTFHSMCVRILRRFYDRIGGNNNFTIYDTDDQKAVIKEVLKTLNFDTKNYPEKACLSAISKAKEEFQTPEDMDRIYAGEYRMSQMARVYREYQLRMKQNNALDFDDLIYKTIELFTKDKEVLEVYQNRFKYIMVDEYQDTNHSQFMLIKLLADKWKNLCVVGDDDQSIYKFRGADISNILDFEKVYPDTKVVKLEQNYRSTSNILNAANAVVANNIGRKEKRLWTDTDGGNRIRYVVYDSEYEEAQGVVNIILDKTIEGYSLSDMAILYRTNAQSRVLEEKLIYSNVPYRLFGGTGFYNRKEIRDILAYLKLISNTSDEVSFARIVNVPKRGIGQTTVNKLRDAAYESGLSMYDYLLDEDHISSMGRSGEKLKEFVNLISSLKMIADTGDLTQLFDSLMEKTGYKVQLINEGTDEAKGRVENIEELKNKISSYMTESEEPSLQELLEEISLVADTDEDDENENKVTLMTIHSAKGLEFPVVFIVGMEERLFPSGLSIDSDDPDAVEEERRLCYVGITRAKKELFLSSATTRMINGNRLYPAESRFIDEIPEEYIEKSGVKVNRMKVESFTPNYSTSAKPFFKNTFTPASVKSFSSASSSGSSGASSGSSLSSSLDEINYSVGDTVRHIKFGKGTVTEMVKGGNDYEITVDFEKVGEKRMFASLAKLKKL